MSRFGVPEVFVILPLLMALVCIHFLAKWLTGRKGALGSRACGKCGQRIPDIGVFCPICGQRAV
jgi:predicted amidophosphoribosyltransferase